MVTQWLGEGRWRVGLIHYHGIVGDNALHAHAALQIVLGEARVMDSEGREVGAPLYVRPMAPHRLSATGPVDLYLVEPSSRLGQALLEDLPPEPIGTTYRRHADMLATEQTPEATELPAALSSALSYLSGEDAMQRTVADAAKGAGVSASALRGLAARHLGVSLARWRLWQALQSALAALAGGAAIADAAFAAGFSDQAHLTRSMKATLGLTPGQVVRSVQQE